MTNFLPCQGMLGGAAEAEKKARMFQQLGCSGSLIKELKLFKKQVSKSSSSYLLTKDKAIISSDTDKLQCWAEHFANGCTSANQLDPEAKHCQSFQSHHVTFQMMMSFPSLLQRRRFRKLLVNAGVDGTLAELVEVGRRRIHPLAHVTV